MAIFLHHPYLELNEYDYIFFRIGYKDYNEKLIPFLEYVKNAATKDKKISSKQVLKKCFQLLEPAEDIGIKYQDEQVYIASTKVLKYFKDRTEFKFEDELGFYDTRNQRFISKPDKMNKYIITKPRYRGLDFLVNTTITNAINKDRFSKFITVDECILYLLEIMKLLRNEYATEKGRKDVLTELRMKAIAAYIAKNVFKLKKEIKNPETISVKKYAHKANSAARILTDGQKDFFTYYPPRSE